MTHAAGWYPDGTGRHVQRYFDGQAWTDHVADATGRQSLDPVAAVPAPRPSPPTPPSPPATTGWATATAPMSFDPPSLPSALTAPRTGPGTTTGAVTLSVGTLVAAAGALLALLSLFVLDVWKAGDFGITLGDIAGAPDGADVNGLAATYAGFGRFLALLAIAAAILAVLQLPGLVAANARLPLIAAAAAGLFALWHLVTLFVAPEGGGMAVTGVLGVIGLAALAAAPFLRQPVGNVGR